MIIYSAIITHRLSYIADFIGRQLTGQPAVVTADRDVFLRSTGARINYSGERIAPGELWIKPHGLLFEKEIKQVNIECFEENGSKAFFKTDGDWPFDILAASFYLLSRYEEYLPHQKDIYGRYAHENALAYREGFLDKPLINIWLRHLREKMQELYPGISMPLPAFQLLPTYDIDEAYCYLHKEWWRSAGAAARDLLQGKWKEFSLRRQVLDRKLQDLFDSYDQLHNLHRPYKCSPRYFFLTAAKTGRYDKNILPTEQAMQRLIKEHADKYAIGIHPSWQSGDDPKLISSEKEYLEKTAQVKVIASRQHFIRFTLPGTFRQLIEAGLKEDFSMGYGSINGFRASVASSFYWYDLLKDEATHLLLFPFCYMEANSYYEQKYTPAQAYEEMLHYYRQVLSVNGLLVTIWHNTFLGTADKFKGWKQVYFDFFQQVMKSIPGK